MVTFYPSPMKRRLWLYKENLKKTLKPKFNVNELTFGWVVSVVMKVIVDDILNGNTNEFRRYKTGDQDDK